MGKGRLICATEFVRVDGDPVERSTKLERAAPKGGVLVDAALAKQWPSDATLAVTPAGEELAKVVGLEACRVGTSAPPERRAA
jgi:class 3 adenylate cyclase